MGRPYKCECGSTDTVSKGARRTKTMGERRIRLCKACGRKFTPKSQKMVDSAEPQAPEKEPVTATAAAGGGDSPSLPAAAPSEVSATGPVDEVIDHPRF